MDKIPYKGKYPSAANYLMHQGIASIPKQTDRNDLKWADGIDISYKLRDLTPVNFREYSDSLLLLAYQEAMRYDDKKFKFARFEVRLGRLKKGRDLPEIASFQCAMHDDPDIMVHGPGYEVPQRHFLYHKVQDILEIAKRYLGKVNKQNPYKVMELVISIREPWKP